MSDLKPLLLFLIVVTGCQNNPKVIEPVNMTSDETPVVSEKQSHEVVVQDFLHASRYTYLDVMENGENYWIAIPYTEVEKGETYFYTEGVLMHNFESKEHDRVFEKLYLVSGVSKTPDFTASRRGDIPAISETEPVLIEEIPPIAGGKRISELFSNPAAFSDQTIIIKGQCVKVNRNIMGKNWVHLQDGSKDADNNNLDLTVSTMSEVEVGEIVVFEGKIVTNKDFGSGYRYDLMMEEATLK